MIGTDKATVIEININCLIDGRSVTIVGNVYQKILKPQLIFLQNIDRKSTIILLLCEVQKHHVGVKGIGTVCLRVVNVSADKSSPCFPLFQVPETSKYSTRLNMTFMIKFGRCLFIIHGLRPRRSHYTPKLN